MLNAIVLVCMLALYSAESAEPGCCSVLYVRRTFVTGRRGPSPFSGRVGIRIAHFEAYTSFTCRTRGPTWFGLHTCEVSLKPTHVLLCFDNRLSATACLRSSYWTQATRTQAGLPPAGLSRDHRAPRAANGRLPVAHITALFPPFHWTYRFKVS